RANIAYPISYPNRRSSELDKEARERVEKLNQADSLIFQTEKQLKEFGDKVPEDKKAPIESALGKLKEAHKNEDIAGIDSSMNELNTAWTAASEEIYKASQGQQQQPGADGTGQPNSNSDGTDNVADAEFEEVK